MFIATQSGPRVWTGTRWSKKRTEAKAYKTRAAAEAAMRRMNMAYLKIVELCQSDANRWLRRATEPKYNARKPRIRGM